MNGVLNIAQAELLAREVVAACPEGAHVSVQVMYPGGKTLAQEQSTQIGYRMQLRLLCLEVSNLHTTVTEIPGGDAKLPQAVGTAPQLIGVAMRLYARSGTPANPTYPSVGIIGLLGLPPEQAIAVITKVLNARGFLVASELPQAGAQN